MTTLDDVERTFDAETVLVCDRDGPLGDRRDHGRPGLRGLRRDDPRPARGRQLERHQHPPHLAAARAALGGLLALREAAAPGALRCGRSGSPRGCWSSSAGRSWCRGRSTSPPRSPSRGGCALRAARVEGLLGMGISQADQTDLPGAARLRGRGRRRGPGGRGPARAPLRRHPRGRPDRGGGAGPRHRRAPADDAARGRRARSAASAASSSCGAGPRTACATSASTRSSAGASPTPARPARLRIPADDPRATPVLLANPLSEDQSAMRTTLLGSLLDVASRNAARGADGLALFESARVYLQPADGPKATIRGIGPSTRWRAISRGSSRRRSPSRTGSRAIAVGPLAPRSWRGGGERRRLLRAQGRAGSARGASSGSSSTSRRRRSRSCIPGRSAAVSIGGDAGRLARRGPPAGLPGLGPRGRRRLRNRRGAAARRRDRSARRPTRTSPPSPPPTRTSPWSSRPRSPAERGPRRRSSPAAASCCARPRSSTSTRASSSARGARAWR